MTDGSRLNADDTAPPDETTVRALVARIVDELLADQADPARDHDTPAPGASPSAPRPPASARPSIAIGADHGGFALKEKIAFTLRERGHRVEDCGTHSPESVDYPDFAHAVARLVAEGACDVGIIVDGAGIGSAMVANKVPGVRAALCYDVSSARNSRSHNHANVLTLGAGLIGPNLAMDIVDTWLSTPWEGGRHARRVAKIVEIERRYLRAEVGSAP